MFLLDVTAKIRVLIRLGKNHYKSRDLVRDLYVSVTFFSFSSILGLVTGGSTGVVPHPHPPASRSFFVKDIW